MTSIGYKRFMYHKASKSFTIEASEIERVGWSPKSQIEVIGKSESVKYVQVKVVKDRDGDVQAWEFAPMSGEVKRVPGSAGTKVVVFND